MEWLILLGVVLGIIWAIWSIFHLIFIAPVKFVVNTLSEAQDGNQRQLSLQSIDPNKGRVKIKQISHKTVKVEGYNHDLKLISVQWDKDSLLENLFHRELEHLEWRMRFISKLQSTDNSQWESILEATWQATRVLEERDHTVGNLFSEEQTRAITQFTDQALVSIYYKSTHANNQSLYNEITQELSKAQEDYEQAEDEIQRRSISTAIKTHEMRLKKQKLVEQKLKLIDGELRSLEATLKLVIEGIRSEISSHQLSKNPRLSPSDSTLLELELPILDEIWQSALETS